MPIGLLILIASSIPLMIAAWIILLILEKIWGGLGKTLRIILIPGTLLHIVSHYLAARVLGVKTYSVIRIGLHERIDYGILAEIGREGRAYLVAMAPLPISLGFGLAMRVLVEPAWGRSYLLGTIVAWLVISFFVAGMPSSADVTLVLLYGVAREPEIFVALLWSPIVFILGIISYGLTAALLGSLIYVFLVLAMLAIPRRHTAYILD